MKLNDLLIPREGELDIQKLTFDYVRHADQTAATPARHAVIVLRDT